MFNTKLSFGFINDHCEKQIGKLRIQAWSEFTVINPHSASINEGLWIDQMDKESFQWTIFDEHEKVCATCRLSIHNGSNLDRLPWKNYFPDSYKISKDYVYASLNRLIVRQDYRGKGISHIMDEARISFVKKFANVDYIIAQPTSKKRVQQFLNRGFELLGDMQPVEELPEVKFKLMHFVLNK